MIIKPLNHWKGVWEAREIMKTTIPFPPHSPDVGMMNIFDDPPFLGVGEKVTSSSELLGPDGSVIESAVRGLLDE